MTSQALFVLLVLGVGTIHIASGSHFRGGIITWKSSSSDSPYKVSFTFSLAFRRSFGYSYYCDPNLMKNNTVIGSGDYWKANGNGHSFNAGSVGYRCTDFSTSEDWSQGENTFNATFPSAGPWMIRYSDCCWISLVQGGSSWYLSSTVNLTRRSDTGSINSSPISSSSPIIRLQQGCKKVIKIPTEDPDGDKVRCRWAVGSSECGGVCKTFKYGRLDAESCTITYDGYGQTGWYAVALMLEDFPQSTVDFSASSPFSSVGLQFLVQIGSNSGSCNRKPYFTGSTPAAGSCVEVRVGNTYHATIEVKHVDSARRVQEIQMTVPSGVLRSNVFTNRDHSGENVYQKNISWTPTSSQVGQHVVVFTALDNSGTQSDQRAITILVGTDRTAPNAKLDTRYPKSSAYYHGYGQYNTWSITFDRPIKKPRKSSYIRFLSNGHVVFKLDTSTSKDVFVTGSTLLSFRTPSVVLSMRGTYSIVIDEGAVVGQGCSSDGPPTPGVTSQDLWRFYAYGYCRNGYYLGTSYSCVDVNECLNPGSRYRRSLSDREDRKDDTESGTGSGRQKRWISYWQLTISPSPVAMPASSVAASPVECSSYTRLSSADRSVGYLLRTWNCDYHLRAGWYRFTGDAGTQMPNYCVPTGRCGTVNPGWLNGTHPTFHDGVVRREVCYHYSGNCCARNTTVWVRNCGGFYIYFLDPPWYYCARYCGNRNVLSSVQVTPQPTTWSWHTSLTQSPTAYYQHLTASSGYINSPSYPYYYPPNHFLTWYITLPYGYARLQFLMFNLENCSSCGCDYLEVIDGPTGQRLGRFCGSNRPRDMYSRGRHLVLRFRSDGSRQYSGFRIYYSLVNSGPSIQPTPSMAVQAPSTSVALPPGECATYRTLSSVDRAAGYDFRIYGRSYQCDRYLTSGWYRFTGDAGTQMPQSCVPQNRCGAHAPGWLNGQHPSVDEGVVSREVCFHWSSGCCNWRNTISVRNCSGFYVYYLSPPSYCWLRYCGNNNYANASWIQPTPSISMTVQVPSSSVAPSSGYSQHLTASSGYISSPNYPSQYYANHFWTWYITLSYGYVRLQFLAFSLEASSGCVYDYLDVIDGPDVNGQRLGRFCGSNRPRDIYSRGRYLVLRFRSDGSAQSSGFRIYYSRVYSVPSSAVYAINPTPIQPYITPTAVQSVAPSASVVQDPFVLYLPANCQHDCVNTPGSYYCRCREGYKLNSDRKTCSDINECDYNNGGCSHHCNNLLGSYYCACLEGQTISSDNKTCVEPGVDVTCNENYMQVDLEREHFKSFDYSLLHLWYEHCVATANSTHISLRTPLNGCGTRYNETNDKIIFYNEVNAKKAIIKNVVTRSFAVSIPFYCEYSKSSIVHVSFKPFGKVKGYENGFGNFTFRMDLFRTGDYRQRYSENEYPISVQLNELLHIQYSVESSQATLNVFADTCRATPSGDFYSQPQYIFLKNGCPEDTTMTFNYTQNPVQRFSIRAFKFLADYPVVYLHCQVMACHKNTVGSRCSLGCQRYNRKKRDLTERETEKPQPKETQTFVLQTGGIVVRKDKTKESSDFDRAQATTVGSVAGVGGLFLIIAIILAAIIIKKGYVKKFKRRNKVDDIYGREQGSRTNNHVEGDDFAVNEEAPKAEEFSTRDEGFVVKEDVFISGEDKFAESGC